MKKRFIAGLILVCMVLGVITGCNTVEVTNAETDGVTVATERTTTTAAITTSTTTTTTVATTIVTTVPEPKIKLPLTIYNNTITAHFYIDKDNVARLYNGTEILKDVRSVHEANLTFTYNGEDKGEIETGAAFFIKTDNTLWAYGKNDQGLVGDDTGIDKLTPDKMVQVTTYGIDNLFCTATNVFFTSHRLSATVGWGIGDWGRWTDEGTGWYPTPIYYRKGIAVPIDTIFIQGGNFFLNARGEVLSSSRYWNGFEEIHDFTGFPMLTDVKQFARAMPGSDGNAAYMGNTNYYYINGDNELISCEWEFDDDFNFVPVKKVIMDNVKEFHPVNGAFSNGIFIIDNSNVLWGMGDNRSGELGDGSKIPRNEPVKIAEDVKKVINYGYLTLGGRVFFWNEEDPTPQLRGVVDIIDKNIVDIYYINNRPWVITSDGILADYTYHNDTFNHIAEDVKAPSVEIL